MKISVNRTSGFKRVLFWLVIVVAFVFVSFQKNKNPVKTQPADFQQDRNYDKAKEQILSLSGKWISTDDSSYMEEWETDDDTLLVGAGYMIKEGRTIRTEKLAIVDQNAGFYYLATVSGQNEGKTIAFGPAIVTGRQVIFENKHHDFPNLLRYTFQNDSTLLVSVESLTNPSMNFQLELIKVKSNSK